MAGARTRSRSLAAALGAIAIAGCGSSAPSLSAFRAGFETDRAHFRELGLDLEATVGGAQNKTNAQLAAELTPLATSARQQSARLAKLNPPATYKANIDKLVTGLEAISVDLRHIASAATSNDAQAASTATRALVADATQVKAADLAIAGALARSKS